MTIFIIYVAQGISVSANNTEQDFSEGRIVCYDLIYTHCTCERDISITYAIPPSILHSPVFIQLTQLVAPLANGFTFIPPESTFSNALSSWGADNLLSPPSHHKWDWKLSLAGFLASLLWNFLRTKSSVAWLELTVLWTKSRRLSTHCLSLLLLFHHLMFLWWCWKLKWWQSWSP